MKIFTLLIAWLFAMLILLSGCGSENNQNEIGRSDSEQYERLDVDYLWQGSVPVEYENVGHRCGEGETYILIPHSNSLNSPLQLEIFGCWLGDDIITCNDGVFTEAEINADNKVVISLWKEEYQYQDCPATEPVFGKVRTIDIESTWPSGELEIVVKHSSDDLVGFVTIE